MTWWHALALGAIQGVTEFLPISSSGHLVLAQYYFGFEEGDSAQELFFDGVLHFGTTFAVIVYFAREIGKETSQFFTRQRANANAGVESSPGQDSAGSEQSRPWPGSWRDLWWLATYLALATAPAAVLSIAKSEAIKDSFKYPRPVAFNLILLGCILLATGRLQAGKATGGTMRLWQVLLIGCAQAASAIFRGLSRSGMTISAALFVGLERTWAIRFSFMLSIIASLGLGSLGILKALRDPLREQWFTTEFLWLTVLGTITSAVVGYLTITPLIWLVQRARLGWFAIYLWLVAALVLATTN